MEMPGTLQYLLGIRLSRSIPVCLARSLLCDKFSYTMEILRDAREKGEGNETHGDRSLSLYDYNPKCYQPCLVSACFQTSVALRFGREVVPTVSTSEYFSPLPKDITLAVLQ